MPRPRPASLLAGRAASFTISPWQSVQRGGGTGASAAADTAAAPPLPDDTDTDDTPSPPASPPGVDYGDADAGTPAAGPTLFGGGYLAWTPAGGVTGHWVDATTRATVAVAGATLPPPPTADACRWGDDRLVGLALYLPGRPDPAAVVLAHAGGGDAVALTAPAPDPRPGPTARAALRRAGLDPVPGLPPVVSFVTRTLLAGEDASRYVARFGGGGGDGGQGDDHHPPPSLIVNVGEFRVIGLAHAPPPGADALYDSDLDG